MIFWCVLYISLPISFSIFKAALDSTRTYFDYHHIDMSLFQETVNETPYGCLGLSLHRYSLTREVPFLKGGTDVYSFPSIRLVENTTSVSSLNVIYLYLKIMMLDFIFKFRMWSIYSVLLKEGFSCYRPSRTVTVCG